MLLSLSPSSLSPSKQPPFFSVYRILLLSFLISILQSSSCQVSTDILPPVTLKQINGPGKSGKFWFRQELSMVLLIGLSLGQIRIFKMLPGRSLSHS
jgi:hypothetical protein